MQAKYAFLMMIGGAALGSGADDDQRARAKRALLRSGD